MGRFVKLPGERYAPYSPIALLPMDDVTKSQPIGRVSLLLQEETEPDEWIDVDIAAVRNAGGVFSYPGLGRTANPNGQVRTHRAQIESDYYDVHQVVFPTYLYDDDSPPNQYAKGPRVALLSPNSRYPFPSHFPHIRGRLTRDTENGEPIVGAEVQHQSLSVFTTQNGEFTLPVKVPAQDTQTTATVELNKINVENARGYARAILNIRFGNQDNLFRVDEIDWEDNSPFAGNYAATLTLVPLDDGDDLPPDLIVATKVSLVSFSLLIDIPPLASIEVDADFPVDPANGFRQFQRIVIPTPS